MPISVFASVFVSMFAVVCVCSCVCLYLCLCLCLCLFLCLSLYLYLCLYLCLPLPLPTHQIPLSLALSSMICRSNHPYSFCPNHSVIASQLNCYMCVHVQSITTASCKSRWPKNRFLTRNVAVEFFDQNQLYAYQSLFVMTLVLVPCSAWGCLTT